ncbi:cell division protein FtsH [Xenorhabdus sp. Reich]|uniref:Cell division protein FtsH n=1 Tax=Xenorhabdus littoralis TaxID=2582835 RepID=A0ABU4SH38_9GAMM|nr:MULTISPECIES: YqjK-like family protein [unclassified Xenorhabdus]MDX7990569.1 cell division protein FtsH [Xenorhabdus sp. psl]MDX7997972.1 cell division protein FtsH [Xenorhabdus sp. Reich]
MNKLRHQQLKSRKQQLLTEIQQQRQSLSDCRQHWFEITQYYDKGWQTLLAFKPYAVIGSGIVLLYSLRHPKKLYRWSRRMINILGFIKIVRNTLHKD